MDTINTERLIALWDLLDRGNRKRMLLVTRYMVLKQRLTWLPDERRIAQLLKLFARKQ